MLNGGAGLVRCGDSGEWWWVGCKLLKWNLTSWRRDTSLEIATVY